MKKLTTTQAIKKLGQHAKHSFKYGTELWSMGVLIISIIVMFWVTINLIEEDEKTGQTVNVELITIGE